MAVDLPVEVVRGHGGERGRPFSLALAPLLLDLDGGIDAACDELKPVAGVGARPLPPVAAPRGRGAAGGGSCRGGGGEEERRFVGGGRGAPAAGRGRRGGAR